MDEFIQKQRLKSLRQLAIRKFSDMTDSFLETCYERNDHKMAEAWFSYVQPVHHLLVDIVQYIRDEKILDYIVLYPFVRKLSVSSNTIYKQLLNKRDLLNFPNVWQIEFSCSNYCSDKLIKDNLELLLKIVTKSAKNVESIIMHMDFGDQFLYFVGQCCEKLKLFESNSQFALSITNKGLAYLSKCQQLTHVMFFDRCDDYDYEDVNDCVTHEGIAEFLISVPTLRVFTYRCIELQKALQFVHEQYRDRELRLEYLYMREPQKDFINHHVSVLCPFVVELSLDSINCIDLLDVLLLFPRLKRLAITNCYVSPLVANAELLGRLSALSIVHPIDMLGMGFFKNLGRCCTSLRELNIILARSREEDFGMVSTTKVFPSLELLHFDGSIPVSLIDFLIMNTCTLTRLFISSSMEDLSDTLIASAVSGALDKLESLHFSHCFLRVKAIFTMIEKCCSLEHIWGLDLTSLDCNDLSFVESYIHSRNLNISLHSIEIDYLCIGYNMSFEYRRLMKE